MDGRLEMPDRRTFQTYIDVERWLQEGDPRWEAAVHQMGDPLLLLTHQQNYKGEATSIDSPELALCLLRRAGVRVLAATAELERSYPTIDFAARHFRQPKTASIPDLPGAPFREMRALYNLGTALCPNSSATWSWRIPAMLLALDRAALALSENPRSRSMDIDGELLLESRPRPSQIARRVPRISGTPRPDYRGAGDLLLSPSARIVAGEPDCFAISRSTSRRTT